MNDTIINNPQKPCIGCGAIFTVKPYIEYSRCSECNKIKAKQYRIDNREKIKAYDKTRKNKPWNRWKYRLRSRKYYRSDRGKIVMNYLSRSRNPENGSLKDVIGLEDYVKLITLADTCGYCGKQFNTQIYRGKEKRIVTIKPPSLGGKITLSNLRVAHNECFVHRPKLLNRFEKQKTRRIVPIQYHNLENYRDYLREQKLLE